MTVGAERVTAPNAPASARAGLLAVATLAAGLLNYAYALGMTHLLPRGDYAEFAAGQGLILFEGVIGSAGVAWVLAQSVGRARAEGTDPGAAVNFGFWVNVLAGVVFALVLGGITLTFADAGVVAAVASTAFTLALSSTGLGYLQGLGMTERMGAIAVAEVLVKCVAGVTFVVVLHWGTEGALLGNLAGAFVPFVSLPMYRRFIGRPTLGRGDAGLWRATGRISVLQAAVGAVSTLDTVIVAASPAAAAGAAAYQAAATLGKIPLYLSTAISTAAFPLLGREGGRRVYATALSSYLLLGMFCVAALATVPPDLVLVIFNDAFADTLRWLGAAAVLGLLIGLYNLVMTCEQAHEQSVRALLVRLATAGVYVAAAVVGARMGGIGGMIGAAGIALTVCLLLLVRTPHQWGGASDAARDLLRHGKLPAAVVILLVLHLATAPAGWLICATVTGLLIVLVAFPELGGAAVGRRLRGRF